MTTRESFNPRLRTSERGPAFGGFAGVMSLASPSGTGRCDTAGEGAASAALSGAFIVMAAFAGSAGATGPSAGPSAWGL